MVRALIESLKGKKILILGFGIEGHSTYQFIRKHIPDAPLVIADKDPGLEEHVFTTINDTKLDLVAGENYTSVIHQFDLVIKSPGVFLPPENRGNLITSQAEIIMQFFRKQVIGITGTKGKSTTASLLFHIFQLAGKKVVLVGNIGIPPLDLVDKWDHEVSIIYELSSHQLEFVKTSPHIAILLNLYQEHLDHFPSFEAYQSAKLHILRYQDKNDFYIYNQDDDRINHHLLTCKPDSTSYRFSLKSLAEPGCWFSEDSMILFNDHEIKSKFSTEKLLLQGDHNLMNVMAAICACEILHLPDTSIQSGLNTFEGLPHRLEYIGRFSGIHFYNDSIATIPEATIHAVRTLIDVDTLILGGFDRGIDYYELVTFLKDSPVHNFIFIGNAGERIMKMMQEQPTDNQRLLPAGDFKEVMQQVKRYTRENAICLLSPAAASYGMFRDFKERGDVFRALAMKL